MDSDDTSDDSSWNLMHKKNDKICIGENANVTQHDPYFENAEEGDDEEHVEAPNNPIISVNVAKNNDCIRQRKNVLEGHPRSRPRSSLFAPFDSNCPKQRRIFNCCDKVDLQTLERGQ